MQARPLYWLSLFFASGMAGFFVWRKEGFLYGMVFLLLVSLIIWRMKSPGWFALLLAAFLGFGYYGLYDVSNRTSLAPHPNGNDVQGEILSKVAIDGDQLKFLFQVQSLNGSPVKEKVACFIQIASPDQLPLAKQLKAGSLLAFPGQFSLPEPARNPGQFDYQKYLYLQRIHWILRSPSFSSLTIRPPSPLHPRLLLDQAQGALSESMNQTFPAANAELMKGMLLGDRSDIQEDTIRRYSDLGMIHVLAISGLHMSVLTGGMLFLWRFLGLTREISLLMTLCFIPAYVLLVGGTPSVLRSGIMSMAVLLGLYLHRPRDGLNFWGAALLLMLIYDPYQIWQIGFQLSFIVTWGLLTLAPGFAGMMPKGGLFLRQLVAVAFTAQLVSFPLTLFYFHQYHLLSLLLNLLLVPLFSLLVIPLGFFALLAGLVHPALALFPSLAIKGLLHGIELLMDWATQWKALQFHIAAPPMWWMVVYYIVITRISWIIEGKKRLWLILSFLLALLPVLSYQGNAVTVTFLDVGQGDAIVIQAPGGKTYLIDGGGAPVQKKEAWKKRKSPYDPGDRIIVPFLKSKGIEQLDMVIMSHGDADHIGGLASVIRQMKVLQVVGNGIPPQTDLERRLIQLIREKGIPLYQAKRGIGWQDASQVEWSVLNPAPHSPPSDNNQSIVLLLKAYGKALLFTGDLEKEGETFLLSQGGMGPIDILKVGHHGSHSSSSPAWIARLRPTWSVVSAGKNNRFGHPHAETLATLERFGSHILRTDELGAITFQMSEGNEKMQTFLQPNGESTRPFK